MGLYVKGNLAAWSASMDCSPWWHRSHLWWRHTTITHGPNRKQRQQIFSNRSRVDPPNLPPPLQTQLFEQHYVTDAVYAINTMSAALTWYLCHIYVIFMSFMSFIPGSTGFSASLPFRLFQWHGLGLMFNAALKELRVILQWQLNPPVSVAKGIRANRRGVMEGCKPG